MVKPTANNQFEMTVSKTELTIRAYNKNANRYNAKFSDFITYKKKIRAFQGKYIPQGARILDLGCGPGNNISTIRSEDGSCHFTGVDLSAKLLSIARAIHPTCDFIELDICNLNLLKLGQYDTVIASFCIVHLNNEETKKLIRDIAERLFDGGSLYLSFMEGKTSGFESTSFSNEEIYFNYYQLDFVLQLLEDNSLKVQEVNTEDYQEEDGTTTSDIFIYAIKY